MRKGFFHALVIISLAAGIFSGCSSSHAINRSILALSCSLIVAYPPDR
nr:MAG TPA: Lysis protein [Caudoviricetes sp.]